MNRQQFIDTQITVRQDFDDHINKNNRRRRKPVEAVCLFKLHHLSPKN